MKKGNFNNFLITDTTYNSTGIAYLDGKKFLLKGAFLGQEVYARLKKYQKGVGILQVYDLVKKAEYEVDAKCSHFGECGGCISQTIPLEKQREFKEQEILNLFKSKKIEVNYLGISGINEKYNYRNKVEFSFGDPFKDGPLHLGFHQRNMGKNILNTYNCMLISEDAQKIHRASIDFLKKENLDYYHLLKREGFLRHLVIRETRFNNEIMVNIVTTSKKEYSFDNFIKLLLDLKLKKKIVSLIHTINDSFSDSVSSDKINVLYGRDYILEVFDDLKFKISPFSFFQTNSKAAKYLYKRINRRIKKNYDTIWDLFCGTGTISQIVSKKCRKVIGVDIVKEAIESAKESAIKNNIKNIEFIAKDVKDIKYSIKENDLVIFDPPRMGLHPKALKLILDIKPKEILYVSCNPKTLVNDLLEFKESGYRFSDLELIDMYPNTTHVECIVLMSRDVA